MNTAFIFPGQGSQSVGMLTDFYQNFEYVRDIFILANDILGYDLWNIIQNDDDKLNQTIYTQVAMLCAGISCFQVLTNETDIKPHMIAGHSLGEITGLVAANVIDVTAGVKIVDMRARLMQNAVPKGVGSMAAILGLDDKTIIQTCSNYDGEGIVNAVNFNAIGQVVIAGNIEAVEKTCATLREQGAKRAVILPISVPSHSPLMQTAGKEFLSFLEEFDFKQPHTKVLQNIDGEICNDIGNIKQKLSQQLYNPVLWVKTIQNMVNNGVIRIIEVGPGKVLSGLNRRINKKMISKTVFDLQTLEELNYE